MDNPRHATLRQSLAERLEAAEPRERRAPAARARWVALQLDNYVERWLAFSTLPKATPASRTQGNLFGALIVSDEALGDVISELPEGHPARPAWAAFHARVTAIQRQLPGTEISELRPLLAGVVDSLAQG